MDAPICPDGDLTSLDVTLRYIATGLRRRNAAELTFWVGSHVGVELNQMQHGCGYVVADGPNLSFNPTSHWKCESHWS
jgi:hypothetical protein